MKSKSSALMLVILVASTSALNLNISSKYESSLRPNNGAVADIVNISMELISIRQIRENDMEFTVDFVIQQHWADPRLRDAVPKEILFTNEVPNVWIPDLYIVNSANSKQSGERSRAFRLKPDGQITLKERMVSQISCSMGFAKFPFDSQECKLHLKSYAYTTIHLDMVWHGLISQNVPVFNNEYVFVSAEQTTQTDRSAAGEFRSLTLTITIRRSGTRCVIRAILPTLIISLVSYLTLFLQSEHSTSCDDKEVEAQATTSSEKSVKSRQHESSIVGIRLIRLLVNGMVAVIFVIVAQMNLMNSPAASTVTGLDIWLGILGLIVFILFLQSLAVLSVPQAQKSGEDAPKLGNALVQKIDKSLRFGIPVFFLIFVVIYFAVYLS